MSMPICPDHGRRAKYRNKHGYWFCGLCLDALFEWNAWIKSTLISPEDYNTMMDKNDEIADEYVQQAIDFYRRNHDIYPDLHPPVGYNEDEN